LKSFSGGNSADYFFSFLPLDFRLALIQLHVSAVKSENLQRACGLVREASAKGAKVVVLPVSKDHGLLSSCTSHPWKPLSGVTNALYIPVSLWIA